MSEKKSNLKWAVILILCLFVLFLNLYLAPSEDDSVMTNKTGYIDYNVYYNEKMPNLELTYKNDITNLPNNENNLIIGINREFKPSIKRVENVLKRLNLDNYDLNIYCISKQKLPKLETKIKIFKYYDEIFDNYFQINDIDKFILLVDENGLIKYYLLNLTNEKNLELLIKRFERKKK